MKESIRSEDLLICNPSFSHLGLGQSVNAKKIMYVQGFTTFLEIDPDFDCYVAVSPFVRDFMREVYDIEAPVIPPYLAEHVASAPLPHPAERRGVLVYIKPGSVDRYSEDLSRALPGIPTQYWSEGPQASLLEAMRAASVFVYLAFP